MLIIESLKKAEGEKEHQDQLKTNMILALLIKKDNQLGEDKARIKDN